MTYEQLQMPGLGNTESTRQASPSCQRAFRVSPIHLQEKVKAMVTSVTCGEKLQDASETLSRAGSSVKIRPVCLPELISGTSNEYLPTLPRWGIACHGEYGALVMSAHRTDATECLLLPTPLASDGLAYTLIAKRDVQRCVYRQHHPEMRGKISGHTKRLVEYLAYLGTSLNRIVELNEMIMGFPSGWSDLDASETR